MVCNVARFNGRSGVRGLLSLYQLHASRSDTFRVTPAQAAALSEIAQYRDGGLRVKLHSKTAALDSLARHLGIFVDRQQIDATFNPLDSRSRVPASTGLAAMPAGFPGRPPP